MKRLAVWLVATLCALSVLTSGGRAIADPGSNQLVQMSQLCTMISNSEFRLNNGQTCTPSTAMVTLSQFTTIVQNNGSCSSSGSGLLPSGYVRYPFMQDLVNCRTLAGQVQASVVGVASGAVPCNSFCLQSGGSPQPAQDLVTSTSSTTINPSSTNPITWSVTASSISGTCTVTLYKGSTAEVTATLSQGVASPGNYQGGAGAGVYTLTIHDSTNNGSCTVLSSSGSYLKWWQ